MSDDDVLEIPSELELVNCAARFKRLAEDHKNEYLFDLPESYFVLSKTAEGRRLAASFDAAVEQEFFRQVLLGLGKGFKPTARLSFDEFVNRAKADADYLKTQSVQPSPTEAPDGVNLRHSGTVQYFGHGGKPIPVPLSEIKGGKRSETNNIAGPE